MRALRHASRQLVRALGLMSRDLDGVGCTVAQCHVLMELAARGCLTTGELASALEIDKSTASRNVQAVHKSGWIDVDPHPADQRTKPLRLTEQGRAMVAKIHSVADTRVGGALSWLSSDERDTVLRGVSLYESALHRSKAWAGLTIRLIERRDDAAMGDLIRKVMTEFGAVGQGYSIEDDEVDSMSRAYQQPRCAYFVAFRGETLLAGGGIAPLTGDETGQRCELRKMYALPDARGLGLGQALLVRCLDAARSAGFKSCYLETLRHMDRARALYEKAGFRRLDGPMGETGHFRCDDWYELDLSQSAGGEQPKQDL